MSGSIISSAHYIISASCLQRTTPNGRCRRIGCHRDSISGYVILCTGQLEVMNRYSDHRKWMTFSNWKKVYLWLLNLYLISRQNEWNALYLTSTENGFSLIEMQRSAHSLIEQFDIKALHENSVALYYEKCHFFVISTMKFFMEVHLHGYLRPSHILWTINSYSPVNTYGDHAMVDRHSIISEILALRLNIEHRIISEDD